MKITNTLRNMSVMAGIAVFSAIAGASSLSADTQIIIDKALNSPTLSVRYTGAKAKLIEFRLNGENIGTRTLSNTKASGETTFSLNVNMLREGDNIVEVRLYDGAGKIVGTEKTTVSTEQAQSGPVFLDSPKMGQTVQGPVDIHLGLARSMRNITVSFFVDNNWKSLINNPPFSYLWDTSRESNGWHEVEAWVVDEGSATLKTRKTRVLVNNPGGKTDRVNTETSVPSPNELKIKVTGGASTKSPNMPNSESMPGTGIVNPPTKAIGTTGAISTGVRGAVAQTKSNTIGVKSTALTNSNSVTPHISPALEVLGSPTRGKVEETSVGIKSSEQANGISMSHRLMGPGTAHSTTVATRAKPKGEMKIVVRGVPAGTGLSPIIKGTKFAATGNFAISFNNSFVEFDVQPRFDHGVPMTPFRHLIEKAGGRVDWEHRTKTVRASADGHSLMLQIGDKFGKIDTQSVSLEIAPYIDGGRTIVPLSFIREALKVDVDYDKESGHVVITTKK